MGEPFLAWAAADHAMFAAEQSGDPLLAAASAWRVSYMITGRKHPHEALELAMAAAAALERTARAPSPERLSVYGALHLAAATAAAASFDRAATRPPGRSSPDCCAANTARRRPNCGPSRAGRP